MGRKKKQGGPGALSADARELVLMSLARKAAAGDNTAARIYLDEYRQQHGNTAEKDLLAEARKLLDAIPSAID